jgi:hypothetical protein
MGMGEAGGVDGDVDGVVDVVGALDGDGVARFAGIGE